jgi:secreted Zn-dependent insulinase-like peptidase
MTNTINAPILLDCYVNLYTKERKDEEVTVKQYFYIVGSLIYPYLRTRPDISYVVVTLSRLNSRPLEIHIIVAKRVLQYLK